MKIIIDKCKKLYNKETPLKIEWILAILIGIIMMLMFNYIDLKSLTVWSTNILDCIADGDITQYYSYTALNKYGLIHQYVSGTLYSLIFWSIWNIPIWAIQYFTEIEIVSNAILLIWSKLFLAFSLIITLITTYKICREIFKNRNISLWIVYLSLTFICTYIGVFYAGQNDIMICMFAVLGLYSLIKEKNIWFYIFSSLAISIKYFYLIPYIPLILLLEKNIWKIILKLGIGILPIILFRAIVKGFPMYGISESANSSTSIFNGFLNSGINIANGGKLSFFVLGFIVICFVAYMTKPKTKDLKNNYIFYFVVAPLIVMFMFSTWYEFYRPILLMPILMILYGFKPELFRVNVILDTIISGAFLILGIINADELFHSSLSMKGTILSKLMNIQDMKVIVLRREIIDLLGDNINIITSLIVTILFAALGIILVINYPKININRNKEIKEKPERWIIWGRSLMVVPAIGYLLVKVIGG